MQRRFPHLCTLAVLSTLAFAILPINAEDKSPDEELVVRVYPVPDLPLYHANSTQMQPQVLMAFMKSLCPGFDQQDGSIAPHETTLSLVVRTTRANHQRISIGLESLRKSMKGNDVLEPLGEGATATSELQQSRPIMLAPDPIIEKIKQLPHKQPMSVPLDLQILSDRFTRTTTPHVWPTWSETEIPDDRDFVFGGVPLTR